MRALAVATVIFFAVSLGLSLTIRAVSEAQPHAYCVMYKDGQTECHMEVGQYVVINTATGAR